MKKIIKILAVTSVLTSVILISSCSNSGNDEEDGKVLKVMISEEPGAENALNNAINRWAKENDVRIDMIIMSNDDQVSKFPAMAKNKDVPDVISATGLHKLYPEEFVDMRDVVDTSLFVDVPLNIVGKDFLSDKITGLPNQFTVTNMYYNKNSFEKAGIEVPTTNNPWTWDELYENAEKLKEDGGVNYGFASDFSRARYDILMYANGGSVVEQNGDGFVITVNSDENINTLERFVKANDDGVMPKAIWAGGSTDNPVEYFKNGDVGILLSGSWNYNSMLNDVTKFDFAVMPTPTGTNSRSSILGGGALTIPNSAKNVELAQEFIQWFYSPENFKDYIQEDKGLSVLEDIIYEPINENAQKDFELLQDEATLATNTFLIDESSSWRLYKDSEYRTYLQRAVSGEMTPKETLDTFANELSEASGWDIK